MRESTEVIPASRVKWCPGTELNRHAPFGARDFESHVPFLLDPDNQAVAITYQFPAWQSTPKCVHTQPCNGHDSGMIFVPYSLWSAHARTLGRQWFCRAGCLETPMVGSVQ